MTSGMEGTGGTTGGMNGGARQGEQLQEAATGVVSQATRTAEAQASTAMTRVGDTLEQVAKAVRDAGNGIRDEQPDIARFVDTAADRINDASTYLRDHDAGETLTSMQDMARRQPAMVIGGGLAIGLLLGRVLRSGASQGQGGTGRYGSGRGYGRDGGSYGTHRGTYGTGYGSGAYGRDDDLGRSGSGSRMGARGRYGDAYAVDIETGYAGSADFVGGTGGSGGGGTALRSDLDTDVPGLTGTSADSGGDFDERSAAERAMNDEALTADEREVR